MHILNKIAFLYDAYRPLQWPSRGRWGVWGWGVCLGGGVCLRGVAWMGVCTPPPCGQNSRHMLVKTLPLRNFVCRRQISTRKIKTTQFDFDGQLCHTLLLAGQDTLLKFLNNPTENPLSSSHYVFLHQKQVIPVIPLVNGKNPITLVPVYIVGATQVHVTFDRCFLPVLLGVGNQVRSGHWPEG